MLEGIVGGAIDKGELCCMKTYVYVTCIVLYAVIEHVTVS